MDGGVTLLSGKKLRPYNKPLKHTIMAGGFAVIDFNAMLLEWVACGVLGIITGLVSVVWDIIVLVKDVVIGAFDLLLFVVYLVSGGSAGKRWMACRQEFLLGIIFSVWPSRQDFLPILGRIEARSHHRRRPAL